MDALNEAIINLVLALFGVLVVYITSLVKAKLKGSRYELLTALAVGGIAYAEEKGAAYLRATGQKLPSAEKRELAVAWFLGRAPGISEHEITQLLESRLPQAELGAAGFLSATAQAIQSPK